MADTTTSSTGDGTDILAQVQALVTQVERRCTWLALGLPDDLRRELEAEVATLSARLTDLVCTARRGGHRLVLVAPVLAPNAPTPS